MVEREISCVVRRKLKSIERIYSSQLLIYNTSSDHFTFYHAMFLFPSMFLYSSFNQRVNLEVVCITYHSIPFPVLLPFCGAQPYEPVLASGQNSPFRLHSIQGFATMKTHSFHTGQISKRSPEADISILPSQVPQPQHSHDLHHPAEEPPRPAPGSSAGQLGKLALQPWLFYG